MVIIIMNTIEKSISLINKGFPILTHYWAIERDNAEIILQFDTKTGMETLYKDAVMIGDKYRNDLRCLAWLPFNETYANIVMDATNIPIFYGISEQSKMICLEYGDTPFMNRETAVITNFQTKMGSIIPRLHIASKYHIGRNKNTPKEQLYILDIINEIEGLL